MTHLQIIEPAAAQGSLRAIYQTMVARPMPPTYRPIHGGAAGIIKAHSLDPELMRRVFSFSSDMNGKGPLGWTQRELVNTVTSRLNQCFY